MLECHVQKEKQKHVFDSIVTELNFHEENFFNSEQSNRPILPLHQCNLILNAPITGGMHNIKAQQLTPSILLGTNVSNFLKDTAQQKIVKAMIAHLDLFINIFTNQTQEPTNWTELSDETKVATQDIKKGKLIVGTLPNNTNVYTDTKDKLENLTLLQMRQ